MKLSLCCIVKNEEACIERMLLSVEELVDEIVVYDTGSTDNTIEIAKKFTDKVIQGVKDDSWAVMRNEALKHVTGDVVLWLDGDEELVYWDLDKARREIEKGFAEGARMAMTRWLSVDEKGNPDIQTWVARLHANVPEIRWERPHHEVIVDTAYTNPPRFMMKKSFILHDPSVKGTEFLEDHRQWTIERTGEIYGAELEKDSSDIRAISYLMGYYFDTKNYDKAIEMSVKLARLSNSMDEIGHALYIRALSYLLSGRLKKARETAYELLKKDWRRSEALLILGDCAYNEGNYMEAQHWHNLMCAAEPPITSQVVNLRYFTWMPYVALFKDLVAQHTEEETMAAMSVAAKALSLFRDAIPEHFANEMIMYVKTRVMFPGESWAFLIERAKDYWAKPIMDELEKEEKMVYPAIVPLDVPSTCAGVDSIWCEGCGELAQIATTDFGDRRIIIHVLGEEWETEYIDKINWDVVTDVIFPNKKIYDTFVKKVPSLTEKTKLFIISPLSNKYVERVMRIIKRPKVTVVVNEDISPDVAGKIAGKMSALGYNILDVTDMSDAVMMVGDVSGIYLDGKKAAKCDETLAEVSHSDVFENILKELGL